MTPQQDHYDGLDSPPGSWNVGALYQHFASIIAEQEKQRAQAFHDLQAQLDRRITVANQERTETEKHLAALMIAGDERLQAHIEAQATAVDKAEVSIDKRLDQLNQLREAVEEDRREFMGRKEADTKHESLSEQIARAEGAMREVFISSADKTAQRLESFGERIDRVESQLDQRQGGEQRDRRRTQSLQPWQIAVFTAVVTALLALMIFAANLVTNTPT